MLLQHPVAYYFFLGTGGGVYLCQYLVALLSVAASMRKLQVVDVTWMSTLAHWNDVVYCW